MVRTAKRTLRDQSLAGRQLARNGVDLRRLQAFRERQRRQYRRQALGHHTLARSWRTYHHEVVTTRGSHLQGALHALLSTDIGEIEVEIVLLLVEFLPRINHAGAEIGIVTLEEANDLGDTAHTIDVELVDHCGLVLISFGDNQSLHLVFARPDGNGEHALDGLQRTVETQLADEHIAAQTVGGNIAIGRKDGYSKREVKSTTHLSETRRREVGRDVGDGKLQTRIEQSCRNAVAALPHGLVAKSREPVTDASRQTHLDGDCRHLQSIYCRAISLDKHRNSYLV